MKNNILLVSLLNLVFVVIEVIGGLITGSVSIISDAVHDLGDAFTLFIAYFLEKKSKKHPDNLYTYGYLRYSLLGSIITALVLLLGSIFVIYHAIDRIMNPEPIHYEGMIIFAIIGLAVNIIGYVLTHKSHNLNEKMISLHLLEDTLSWFLVIIISVVMLFTDWYILDPILSIGIALFILYQVCSNVKKSVEIFLEKTPDGINIEQLAKELKKKFNLNNVHHIHIWSMDGISNYLTMHVVLSKDEKKDAIISLKKDIKEHLKEKEIGHATIEIEYVEESCHDEHCEINEAEHSGHHHHHH